MAVLVETNINGGAGGIIRWPDGSEKQFKSPAGTLCTSYRAELVALREALILIEESQFSPQNSWFFTDSESTVERLKQGPGAQADELTAAVWLLLDKISRTQSIMIQWIPGHKGIDGNEKADQLAKEGATMQQVSNRIDFQTVKTAIKLHMRYKWRDAVLAQEGIYFQAGFYKLPATSIKLSRAQEVIVLQLRTGTLPLVRSCWARYMSMPEAERMYENECSKKEDVKPAAYFLGLSRVQCTAVKAFWQSDTR